MKNAYFAIFLNRYVYGQERLFFFQDIRQTLFSPFFLPKNRILTNYHGLIPLE